MLRVFLLALLAVTAYGLSSQGNRIIGGELVADGELPFMCSIRGQLGDHQCGCVVLNDKYVLTTGRCSEGVFEPQMNIKAGSNHINVGGEIHSVGRVTRHGLYDPDSYSAPDLAVISINGRFNLTAELAPALLPEQDQDFPGGSAGIVAGWGWTVESSGPFSSQLLKADQTLQTIAECQAFYPGVTTTEQLCADMPEGGMGPCNGDWGGPLIVDGMVIGLASWSSNGCATQGYPTVYTRVASFREWIRDQTGA